MKSVHVFISGRVQGVFFRSNTVKKAQSLGLKGFIRNLEDGRVEVVFEGDEAAIKKMLEFCKRGQIPAKVTNVKIKEEKYKGEFKDFEVRY